MIAVRSSTSMTPILALVAVLAFGVQSRADVVYKLLVDPVRSPGSVAADVRVILGDYESPRPFHLDVGVPFLPPPDTGVAVRVSHLRSTFAEVGLVGLAGQLSSLDGSTIDSIGLTGSYVFPFLPGTPPPHPGFFLSMGSTLPLGTVQLAVIGTNQEVETIFGRFELASTSTPEPSGAVLFGVGLMGVGAVRVLWRRAAA